MSVQAVALTDSDGTVLGSDEGYGRLMADAGLPTNKRRIQDLLGVQAGVVIGRVQAEGGAADLRIEVPHAAGRLGATVRALTGADGQRFLWLIGSAEDDATTGADATSTAPHAQRAQLLLDLQDSLLATLDLTALFSRISPALRRALGCEMAAVMVPEDAHWLRMHVLDFPGSAGVLGGVRRMPIDGSIGGRAIRQRTVVRVSPDEVGEFHPAVKRVLEAEGLQSMCALPLVREDRVIGSLFLASRSPRAFADADLTFLGDIAAHVAQGVERALQHARVQSDRTRLRAANAYLERELRDEVGSVIGTSPAWIAAVDNARRVASTDTTVLLLGETGTGKEVVARYVHDLSGRRTRPFVRVNCAALPASLLESELFGHEKGAFTGALNRRQGRFEIADGGTLLLDEVGELPLDLQPKLLRVLQEGEFERLGGNHSLRVNVRVVAATNRDLQQMVDDGEFRPDLFFRLSVFPIVLPPLRERRSDIRPLLEHFVRSYAQRLRKEVGPLDARSIRLAEEYDWPGNVRELQNIVERAVVLWERGPLVLPPLVTRRKAATGGTLREVERRRILDALEEAGWVVAGPQGAAARLGLKRTSLQARMRKLGITRADAPARPRR